MTQQASTTPENRLGRSFDAALHLLDRQLIDSDGHLIGKVDDVELTETADGLVITALLTGTAALLDRTGGRLGAVLVERWGQLRPSEPGRTTPWRIDIAQVDWLDSAVHLAVSREGILRRDREERRLGRLTGMKVSGPAGIEGRVLDVRVAPAPSGALAVVSLIVGGGGPGSLLGYERRAERGPWLVRAVVGWIHRDTALVDIADAAISWEQGTVRLATIPSRPVGHAFDDGRRAESE